MVKVSNNATFPVEVKDVQMHIEPEYPCHNVQLLSNHNLKQKYKQLIIGPFEPSDLLKVTLSPSQQNENREYVGRIVVVTETLHNNQQNTITLNFKFAKYFSPVTYFPLDLAIYANLHDPSGMQSDSQQKISKSLNKQNIEILEIEKDIYIKNNFTSSLFITNIYSHSQDVIVKSIKQADLPAARKLHIFTVLFTKPISELKHYFLQSYLTLEISHYLHMPLPFLVYDKSLQCYQQETIKGRCSQQGVWQHIDFGYVGINE